MLAAPQVQFYPGLVAETEALTHWLAADVAWQDEEILMFGKEIKVPRQVAWFGDAGLNYRYSGRCHPAKGWPPLLSSLGAELFRKLAVKFNFVLANRYRTGADYMGWHKDDERTLTGPVVSVSFGATRRFRLEEPGTDRPQTVHSFELSNGSVLVHPRHWRHTLPKTAKPVTERFNLSFRQVQSVV